MKTLAAKNGLLVCALLMLVACGSSPTGRSQLKLFSDSQLAEIGKQTFAQIKKEEKIATSPQTNQYVQCVADSITVQVAPEVFAGTWEVVVFNSNQVNAFALPGGKIGVYTGLLEIAENADQLAAVIGHEVGHVIAGHGNERASSDSLINTGLQISSILLNQQNVNNKEQIMQALGLGAQVGIALPYSRIHETEADTIGLELMTKAGFNPEQSVELWKNMSKNRGEGAPLELLSTHPSPATRIEHLQQTILTLPKSGISSFKPTCD